ncbi:hypothetical protein SUGI_0973060 [Cryptomeria japonica]|nr:hypothetical protein SUGI_0973060 [Cryptomeria japonica]
MVDKNLHLRSLSSPPAIALNANRTSGEQGETSTQDTLLPIANVSKIMRRILPPNAKVSKEAKDIMQECASEFVAFVTAEASLKCQKQKRKTINGEDLLSAMASLGFENHAEQLKSYLLKYKESEGEKFSVIKQGLADLSTSGNGNIEKWVPTEDPNQYCIDHHGRPLVGSISQNPPFLQRLKKHGVGPSTDPGRGGR